MNEKHESALRAPTAPARRNLLAAAVLAPALAGAGTVAGAGAAHAAAPRAGGGEPVRPVITDPSDWADVGAALGRPGSMLRGLIYRTPFLRHDLRVVSEGIAISPALAVGSYVAFVRYADGSTMAMGDLTVTENELQAVTAALQEHHIGQTAIHKHLLSQRPALWWTHIHGHGADPVALATGIRAAIDRTGTPPPPEPPPARGIDLDTAGMEEALGSPGTIDGGVFKIVFLRRETVVEAGLELPRGLGATTAFNFQPLGGGRAALNGDFAMTAGEVQDVLTLLSRNRIGVVTLHNHMLREEPRLFFVHLWAVGDGVELARALRPAVDVTNVVPPG
ncbi:DUF1259 domain-containing protein [Streptomyces litchfieldiae]|uniref:DUF1259 domain-containing protein n=1 Tax=Streptomyces litchfieldiae TaxID=3075543 RepID=A0ABU2MSU9_9ACTN|nr:DUF1259 domain-containing protein [Streptomyces sp. DSM 44938]MDT0344536.1 DUF1259 domain-containing protein [Streptomyces sp. DSM 44938]